MFVGPLESVFRYPLFAIVPVVALVLAGLAVGLLRSPVYTAEARISVGRVDVPAYTLQGVTVGNSTLAASYARALGGAQRGRPRRACRRRVARHRTGKPRRLAGAE